MRSERDISPSYQSTEPGAFQQPFVSSAAPSAAVSPSPECSFEPRFILRRPKTKKRVKDSFCDSSCDSFCQILAKSRISRSGATGCQRQGVQRQGVQEAMPVGVVKSFATPVSSSTTVRVTPGRGNVPEESGMPHFARVCRLREAKSRPRGRTK